MFPSNLSGRGTNYDKELVLCKNLTQRSFKHFEKTNASIQMFIERLTSLNNPTKLFFKIREI